MKNLIFLAIVILLFGCSSKHSNQNQKLTFTPLKTNSDASLRGLHVVDGNTIWASGSKGTVLLSLDGGESWKINQIPGAEENDFRSIYAWDEKQAMVFGVAGPTFAYKTNDGGASWEVVFQDTTSGLFFNSLKFADEKNGLAISDPIDRKFFLLRTENAGEKWERVYKIPPVEEGEANFAASNTCIEFLPTGKAWIASGGKAARAFYSVDFGKSWEVVRTPMVRGEASSGIFSVAFQNNLQGVMVGGIYDQPELNANIAAFTSDGGKTWISAEKMPKEYRSCVQPISENIFLAIGKTGWDISTDAGLTWNFLSDEGYYTFRPVPGKLKGFAAGNSGRITKWKLKK